MEEGGEGRKAHVLCRVRGIGAERDLGSSLHLLPLVVELVEIADRGEGEGVLAEEGHGQEQGLLAHVPVQGRAGVRYG